MSAHTIQVACPCCGNNINIAVDYSLEPAKVLVSCLKTTTYDQDKNPTVLGCGKDFVAQYQFSYTAVPVEI